MFIEPIKLAAMEFTLLASELVVHLEYKEYLKRFGVPEYPSDPIG